jgi:hypothetical protein
LTLPEFSSTIDRTEGTTKGENLRRIIPLIAACAVALAVVAVASANGAGTVSQTFTSHTPELLFTDNSPNPCTGDAGTFAAVASNQVFHITTNVNGAWATGTAEGTATFTPTDTNSESFSGHFAAWFGDSDNPNIDVEHDIFNVVLTGTDGSRVTVHMIDHVNIVNGVPTLSFSKTGITCG